MRMTERSFLYNYFKKLFLLPNEISATLPATGEYLITVVEQPKIAKSERYRGPYCLSLEASPEIMETLKPALWGSSKFLISWFCLQETLLKWH